MCLCSRLKSSLDKGGVIQEFVEALQQLTNPEMLFKVRSFCVGAVMHCSIMVMSFFLLKSFFYCFLLF